MPKIKVKLRVNYLKKSILSEARKIVQKNEKMIITKLNSTFNKCLNRKLPVIYALLFIYIFIYYYFNLFYLFIFQGNAVYVLRNDNKL